MSVQLDSFFSIWFEIKNVNKKYINIVGYERELL